MAGCYWGKWGLYWAARDLGTLSLLLKHERGRAWQDAIGGIGKVGEYFEEAVLVQETPQEARHPLLHHVWI